VNIKYLVICKGIIEIILTLAVVAAFVLGLIYKDDNIKMMAFAAFLTAWKGLPLFNDKDTTKTEATATDLGK